MSAEAVAKALGGRRTGGAWIACCPAHDDRAPSLAIREAGDNGVLAHCHAGCGREGIPGPDTPESADPVDP
jgi:DNA primase